MCCHRKIWEKYCQRERIRICCGYVVGNDVSARTWQLDPKYAGGAPQWCFSKSFDKYAPLGPQLVSPAVLTDPSALHLQTRVNGELRQDSLHQICCSTFQK